MVTQTSRTYAFGELLTTKLRTFMEENPVEQSQLGNAFMDKVYQTNKHSVNASNEYTVPVSFLEAQKGGWYDGADVTSTAGSDDVTIAHYDTAFNTEPVKLLRTEMKRGAKGIFDLMKHKSMQWKILEVRRLQFSNRLSWTNKLKNMPCRDIDGPFR